MKALILLLTLPLASFAEDSGRRYDSLGRFNGTYREASDGTLRLYDESGRYEGKVVRRDKDTLVRYDASGSYRGTVEESDE